MDNDPMNDAEMNKPYDLPMLTDALARARRLVEGLEKAQAETEAPPPDLSPEKLAEGKMALDNALAAARRTQSALNAAYEIALLDIQDTDNTDHASN
jgi:hypothetical protein